MKVAGFLLFGWICLLGVSVHAISAPSAVVSSQGTSTQCVVVQWGSVSNAVAYQIQRGTSLDVYGELNYDWQSGWVQASGLEDTNAALGVVFYYQVRASASLSGTAPSAWSSPLVRGFRAMPLAQVMPGSPLRFASGGDAEWVGQYPPRDLDAAFVNQPVTSDQSTWLSLEVHGPGTLTFQWRTDCDFWDDFTCKVNGSDAFDPIFGVTAWEPHTLMLYDETNIVSWVYNNTPWGNDGLGWVWVKDVVWEPSSGTVLPAPTNVHASDGAFVQKTRITWDAVDGATHYEVSRADAMNGVKEVAASWSPGLAADDTGGTAGTSYYYFVRAATNAVGAHASDYSYPDIGFAGRRPDNDYFRDVAALAGSYVGVTQGDCTWASVQSGEPVHGGFTDATNSAWWSWTAATNAAVTFKVRGSVTNYQAVLAVYTNAGSVVGTLMPIASGWQNSAEWATVTYQAVAGTTYYIAVAGRSGMGSPVTLRWAIEGWQFSAPLNVQATDGILVATVRVTWDGVSGADAYEVSRSATADGVKTVLSPWMTSSSFDDTSASNGSTNSYTVRAAFDKTGWAASSYGVPDTGYGLPRPANDLLAQAQVLEALYGGSLLGSCVWASFETGEPLHGGVEGATNSVWWSWTAATNAAVTFEAQGSGTNFSAVLAVYTNAGTTAGTLVPIIGGQQGTNGWARVTVTNVVRGATYLVAVAGRDGVGSPVSLRWSVQGWLCPAPANVKATDGTLFETVRVTWDALPDASYYEVWRSESPRTNSVKTKVASWTALRSVDDTTANPGVTYYYFVRAATDASGWLMGTFSLSDTGYSGRRPVNDNLISATSLTGVPGSAGGDSTLATLEAGEPQHGGFPDAGASVWWRWTSQTNSAVVFETQGSSGFNAVLAVYTNASGGTLASVASTERGTNAYAQVTFNVKKGVTYLIAVAGRGGAGGPITLNRRLVVPVPENVMATDGTLFEMTRITWDTVPGATRYEVSRAETEDGEKTLLTDWTTELSFDDWWGDLGVVYYYFVRAAVDAEATQTSAYSLPDTGFTGERPSNDNRANAFAISGFSGQTQGDSTLATLEVGEPQHGGFSDAGASIWWRWVAPTNATVVFDTQGSSAFDTVFAVYTNTTGNALVPVASAERDTSAFSRVAFNAVAGRAYWIAVAGRPDTGGQVTVNWALSGWVFSAPGGVQATDGTLLQRVGITWAAVTGATHYELSRAESASGEKTVLVTWLPATSFDDTTAVSGKVYYYFVRAASDAAGTLAGAYSQPESGFTGERPANDDRSNAEWVNGLSGSISGDSTLATLEAGEPQHGGFSDAGASLWWRWTAPVGAPVTFATEGGVAFNAVLAVYTNAAAAALSQVAAAERGTNLNASVTFEAQAGRTYLIALAGRPDHAGGPVTLSWSLGGWTFPAPSNVVATGGTVPEATRVTWTDVPDAPFYEVSRAETAEGIKTVVMPWTAAPVFTDLGGTVGQTYFYFVRGALDSAGTLAGVYGGPTQGWSAARPPNDKRANATLLSGLSGSVSGDSAMATLESVEPQHGGFPDAGKSLWWRWTAPVSAPVTFDTQGSGSFDAVLAIYTNSVGETLSRVADAERGTNAFAQVRFDAVAGETYLIAVAGRPNAGGAVALNWTYGSWGFPAPASVQATGGTRLENTRVTWTAVPGATYYEVSRAETTGGVRTTVMPWSVAAAYVDTNGMTGQTYFYFVRAALDAAGTLAGAYGGPAIGWAAVHPANDMLTNAFVLTYSSGSVTGDCAWATSESGEPAHGGFADATNSIWWSWTAPSNGVARFDTQGSVGTNWVLAVYTNGVGGLLPVASAERGTNAYAQVMFNVMKDNTYLIALAGRQGEGGAVTLNWTFEPSGEEPQHPPPPPNIVSAVMRTVDGVRKYKLSFIAKKDVTYEVLTASRLASDMVWHRLSPAVTGCCDVASGLFVLEVPMTESAAFFKIVATKWGSGGSSDEPPHAPLITQTAWLTVDGQPTLRIDFTTEAAVRYMVKTKGDFLGVTGWQALSPSIEILASDANGRALYVPVPQGQRQAFFMIEASR